jgi:hypothetical protein
VECNGSGICEHKIEKSRCIPCHGSQVCDHDKLKRYCKDCQGSGICEHDKIKTLCKTCYPNSSQLCKNSWCYTRVHNIKYKGFCLLCFIHEYPDEPCFRNYKTKETTVVHYVKESFSNYEWIHDKRIQNGVSNRRPDLFLKLNSHMIVVEIDEEKHDNYSCENRRIMEISQDVHHRPIIFIRFNPDKYTDKDGNKIGSCWKLNKLGVMQIMKTKEKEWQNRLETLKKEIETCIELNKDYVKMIEIKHLFYE